jgi:LysM repeat protein
MVGKSVRLIVRLMAPVALIAVTVGVYLIVHSTLNHRAPAAASSRAVVHTHRQPVTLHHVATFYSVRPGDTLSAIAARTGVPMSRLTSLNPSLAGSPNSLQAGQRLRLRR